MSESPWLPFAGLRVLDISQGIAGPYCAQILWQQGADVIKVEPPEGDWGRGVGVVRGQHSALSVCYNAGKRGVCIDARQAEGLGILRRLADQADIIVQNFRPGVAERLGLGGDALCHERPELIYVSISGYGPDGPASKAPASDSVMQADSGLMFTNQDDNGQPQRVGMLLADVATGLYAAQATAAALYRKAISGQGMHVSLSLFEACANLQSHDMTAFALTGERRAGAVSAPNGVFATQDGRLSVLTLNNDQFLRLCRAFELTAWEADPRFVDNATRMQHRAVLHDALATLLRTQPSAHWIERLQREQVLHAPVRDYDDVAAHPQARHLGLFQSVEQPGVGVVPTLAVPGLGGRRAPEHAPDIGEHTMAVLGEAGFDLGSIESWLAANVIAQAGQ